MKFDPFAHSIGPRPAKIAFVGESWGAHEEMFKVPLVWWSGVELARMLYEVGLGPPLPDLSRRAIEMAMIEHWHSTNYFYTNVFCEHPPDNKIEAWCIKKSELPPSYAHPYYRVGQYFQPDMLPHLDRLYAELKEVQPNLVVAMGNAACWALLDSATITKLRGAIAWSPKVDCKVLPTFHPAYILRQWSLRVVVIQDLLKARREAEFKEIRRPQRWIITSPTLAEIQSWADQPAKIYACDSETERRQISMISFARSASDCLVIPFIVQGRNYWPTLEDEVRAWRVVQALLEGPAIKIFQNGLYDLSYIAKMGIRPRNCTEDTMLLHHSHFPELRKGLDFLGSIYTNEIAWKILRERPRDKMIKREE